MNGKKSKALRRKAKPLFLALYKELLPEGTEVTIEQAIKYSPKLWKKLCRAVKRKPELTLDELSLK
jgi:hypothetical protein